MNWRTVLDRPAVVLRALIVVDKVVAQVDRQFVDAAVGSPRECTAGTRLIAAGTQVGCSIDDFYLATAGVRIRF